jgi:hypothetical protein
MLEYGHTSHRPAPRQLSSWRGAGSTIAQAHARTCEVLTCRLYIDPNEVEMSMLSCPGHVSRGGTHRLRDMRKRLSRVYRRIGSAWRVGCLLVCGLLVAACGRTIEMKEESLDGVATVRVPDVFERVPGVADNHAGEVNPYLPPLVPLAEHTDRQKLTFYFTASTYHDAGGNRHIGELLAITLYHQPADLEARVEDHLAYVLDHAMVLDVQWPRVATREEPVPNAQGGTTPSFSPITLPWQEPLEEAEHRIDIATGSYPYVGFWSAGEQREARLYILTDREGRFRLTYTSQRSHRSRDLMLDWLRQIAASTEITPRLVEHFDR